MIIFIVNDFFMRIRITENQYTKLVEQADVKCVPTGKTQFNQVDVSFYDILYNGVILNYGDQDLEKTHPIWVIQKKLGIGTDGYYGKDMLKSLSTKLGIDLCKQKNNNIPIGPVGLQKLGLWVNIPEDNENYILASTLVGENQLAEKKELHAILSTIKNRAVKCGYSMKESVLKGKQYSTWNYFNRLDEEGQFEELYNRISNQKTKGFDNMLKIVQNFGVGDVIKVNHYVNDDIVDLSVANTRTISKSYNNNKKTAKKIGDHTFWFDKRHPC